MAIPKYDKLMKLFLYTLADGWVHKLKDITAKLAVEFHLSQDEPEEVLSGGAGKLNFASGRVFFAVLISMIPCAMLWKYIK